MNRISSVRAAATRSEGSATPVMSSRNCCPALLAPPPPEDPDQAGPSDTSPATALMSVAPTSSTMMPSS
eukprot:8328267-Alexandrium_andersonii.AAC.1